MGDWGVLATKIPAENKAAFGALKMKLDKHTRAINALPEALPAIDFEVYRSKVAVAGFNTELAKWEAMMPVEEMNLEEALDAGLIQFVIDPSVPSLFPHDQTWEEYAAKLEKADPHNFHQTPAGTLLVVLQSFIRHAAAKK